MDNEEWTEEDDVQFAAEALPETHPGWTVFRFFIGMTLDLGEAQPILERLVTPRSRDAWGDFTAVRDYLDSIPGVAWGSQPEQAPGAPDVVYMKVLDNVDRPHIHQNSGREILVPAILTLIWNPEPGIWQIHSIGDRAPVGELPRYSPGVAPTY